MLPSIAYVLLLVAAVVGAGSTYLLRVAAERLGWLDPPNPIVPQHRHPVARPGGLAIAAASTAVLGFAWIVRPPGWTAAFGESTRFASSFAIPALLFLLLGLLDDRMRLQPAVKLVLQVAAAAVAVRSGIVAPFSGIRIVDVLLSGLWIVTLVNAFNLIDVCDGLLAGLVVLVLLFLCHRHPEQASIGLAVGGACLGFLAFNRPPASVFLGDSGSHFSGFVVAGLLLTTPGPSPAWRTIPGAILVVGLPLFELVFVTLVRLRKGLPWWRGSPDHLALRLQAAGLSRLQTDLVVWSTAGILLVVASAFDHVAPGAQLLLLLGVAAALFLWGRWLLRWEVQRP